MFSSHVAGCNEPFAGVVCPAEVGPVSSTANVQRKPTGPEALLSGSQALASFNSWRAGYADI